MWLDLEIANMPDTVSEPAAVLSSRSFGAKADVAAVSRQAGIHAASRRWLSFGRWRHLTRIF
jgi:hypothetical protein